MAKCCENGHADADEHAHQHHTGSSGDDKCLVEDSSLFSFEQNETMKHRVASCHHDHSARAHLFFALCCLAAVALLYEAEIANHSSQYGECHACFYQSVHAGRDNGLRAPPCLNV
ncbi:MAG: hypothetical protein LBF85_02930 [Tannerella sp.]|nr:hypothetical protein [Tannerella sp.]